MLARSLLCLFALSLVGVGCGRLAPREPSPITPAACPVTRQPSPAFAPPPPFPSTPAGSSGGEFWYGSPALWTMLDSDGAWADLPRSEAGLDQKVFWWAESYDMDQEPIPALTVTGRRLDGAADSLTSSEPTNAYGDSGPSMLVGVVIPTPGCWEITGSYRGQQLTFVVQVEP